jgi:hypothetical protein
MTVINPGGGGGGPATLPIAGTVVAGSPAVSNKLLAGDADPALQINGDGSMLWGPGGATPSDTELLRTGAGILQIWNPANHTSGELAIADCKIYRSSVGWLAIDSAAGATLQLGDPEDVAIYRAGANLAGIIGNLDIATLGQGLQVKEGVNAKQGVGTLVAGTVTIANTNVTANSRIFITPQEAGALTGVLRVSARVAGTSFTVSSSIATDTVTFAYEIFEPG